jgi:hypothetical protein
MDLTEGSETSAKLNLTPGKYPKENIKDSKHGANLKSRILCTRYLNKPIVVALVSCKLIELRNAYLKNPRIVELWIAQSSPASTGSTATVLFL